MIENPLFSMCKNRRVSLRRLCTCLAVVSGRTHELHVTRHHYYAFGNMCVLVTSTITIALRYKKKSRLRLDRVRTKTTRFPCCLVFWKPPPLQRYATRSTFWNVYWHAPMTGTFKWLSKKTKRLCGGIYGFFKGGEYKKTVFI